MLRILNRRLFLKAPTSLSHNPSSIAVLTRCQIYTKALSTFSRKNSCSLNIGSFQPTSPRATPYGSKDSQLQDDGTYAYFGPVNEIRHAIYNRKHKKWGFVIYRCDYASDETWAKFLAIVKENLDTSLKLAEAEDLKSTLDMTPRKDKKTLDGATVDQVREIFKEWVNSDEAKAEANNEPYPAYQCPRYQFCVHVDADVLDAVVHRAPKLDVAEAIRTAYVNLVKLRDEVDPEQIRVDDENEEWEEEEILDVAKVRLSRLNAFGYNRFDDFEFDGLTSWSDENGVSM